MIGGTWREFGLYRKLCPPDRKRMSTLPIVLGKATVYGLIYGVTTFYILGLHYRLFHYPMNGATSTVVVFMLAYLAACIFRCSATAKIRCCCCCGRRYRC